MIEEFLHKERFQTLVPNRLRDYCPLGNVPGFLSQEENRLPLATSLRLIRRQCGTNLHGSADSSILKKLKRHFLGQPNTAM